MKLRFNDKYLCALPKNSNFGAWRCLGTAFITLVCFVGLNMAGCGGSGGGGLTVPANAKVTVHLLDITGKSVPNTAVVLDGKTQSSNTSGVATFLNVAPGSYSLVYTINGVRTSTTVAVGTEPVQNFVAVQGQGGVSSVGIVVRGFIYNSDTTTNGCDANATGVTAPVLVRVRDLNTAGEPIVASYTKPDQGSLPASQHGAYSFFGIPYAGTFEIEVRPQNGTSAPFNGQSAAFTVNANQTLNTNICVSATNPTIPPPPATATPVGSPTPTAPASSYLVVFASWNGTQTDFAHHIFTMSDNGTNVTQLTNVASADDRNPVYRPDGTKIFFTRMSNGNPTGGNNGGLLYSMNADGSGQSQVGNISVTASGPGPLKFSPDGKWLLGNAVPNTGSNGLIVSSDGLTSHKQEYGHFSPDGTKIVSDSDDLSGSAVVITNSDGTGTPIQLAGGGTNAMFSLDGTQVVFTSGTTTMVVNTDGTGLTQTTSPPPTFNDEPRLRPDKLKFVLYSAKAQNDPSDIYIETPDGTDGAFPNSTAIDITNSPLADDVDPTYDPKSTTIGASRTKPTVSIRSTPVVQAKWVARTPVPPKTHGPLK